MTATADHWASPEQVIFARLCFAFLLISPSYELARKHRLGLLTTQDMGELPADFEVVLGTFDLLGDIRHIPFTEWWLGKGIEAFGCEGARPIVFPIDAIWPTKGNLVASLNDRMNGYLAGQFRSQDPQACMILSVPLSLTKSDAIEQIKDVIEEVPLTFRSPPRRKPPYPLFGQKQDLRGVSRYLKCAMCRVTDPRLKLWEIGVIADLSTTYSSRLALGKGTPDDQQNLKMLASRALNRAGLIAENAARGLFPTYDKCQHAVKPDWASIGDVFTDHDGWIDQFDGEAD